MEIDDEVNMYNMCTYTCVNMSMCRRSGLKKEAELEMEEVTLKASLDKLGVPPLIKVHFGFPLYKVVTDLLRWNWKRGRTNFGLFSYPNFSDITGKVSGKNS